MFELWYSCAMGTDTDVELSWVRTALFGKRSMFLLVCFCAVGVAAVAVWWFNDRSSGAVDFSKQGSGVRFGQLSIPTPSGWSLVRLGQVSVSVDPGTGTTTSASVFYQSSTTSLTLNVSRMEVPPVWGISGLFGSGAEFGGYISTSTNTVLLYPITTPADFQAVVESDLFPNVAYELDYFDVPDGSSSEITAINSVLHAITTIPVGGLIRK